MTMKNETLTIKRTVELMSGSKVEKSADLKINVPESLEEAQLAFGDDLWKWARQGYRAYAQQIVRMKLGGGESDGRKNKLLRQFREAIRTFTDVLDMNKEEALAAAMSKEKFQPLKEHFANLENVEKQSFDFTGDVKLQTPRWFAGDAEEEDENEETEA